MNRNEGWQTPLVARTSHTPCKIGGRGKREEERQERQRPGG